MTDKMEQAFLDGTHPALTRDAQAASTLREQPLASEQEDNHSQHSDDDGHDKGAAKPAPEPQPPLRETTNARMQPSQPAARRRGEESRNTGVKGVKADYAEAMARQQQHQQQPHLARSLERNLKLNDNAADEEDELALVRRKRLAELQGSGERRAGPGRTFGHLSEVGMEGFVAAVEDEDPETAVVVHLYEPEIPTCALLNSHLASLARLHPSTKFLRALASELDFMQPTTDDTTSLLSFPLEAEADNATLPTVLVYRAGELETTWVRFDFELPGGHVAQGEQGKRHVEEVLYNAGVISSLTSAAGDAAASGPRSIRRTTRDSDGDDDDD
ncbi:hypothetical protein JCM8115_006863 [Rhodotorula mucilaginosa]